MKPLPTQLVQTKPPFLSLNNSIHNCHNLREIYPTKIVILFYMTKSPTSLILFIAIIFSMSLGFAYTIGYGSIQSVLAITPATSPALILKKITPPNSGIGYSSIPTPTFIGNTLPTPTPTRVGSSLPSPTPTRIGTSFPSPTPTGVGNTGPTNTLLGNDGTYCKDYGLSSYRNTGNYCIDTKGIHYDYCSTDMARQYYCSGSWNGKSWTGVYCADGGYSCSSFKLRCSNGGCVDPKLMLR